MLKTKKVEKIITIVFLMYLTISLAINIIQVFKGSELEQINTYSTEQLISEYKKGYNETPEIERQIMGMESIENLSHEEAEATIKKYINRFIVTMLFFAVMETIMGNIMFIVIFIIIIVANRKSIKRKLNKDDFYNSTQYYRDILEQKRNM